MPPTLSPRRGDVVRVLFRNLDPHRPDEPFKTRPALVLQGEGVQGPYTRWVMASFTTNLEAKSSTRIFVGGKRAEAREMGLARDCMLCLDDLETIPPWRVVSIVGRCPFMDQVDPILRRVVGL